MRKLRARRPDLQMAPAFVPELIDVLRKSGAAVYPLVIMPDGSFYQDIRMLAPARAGALSE